MIRISQPVYPTEPLIQKGIQVHEMPFEDGHFPDKELLERFKKLIASFGPTPFAIHCVSGIGRAPLIICLCLIQKGMDPLDAVKFIRSQRRGAINKKQLDWLLKVSKKKSWLGKVLSKLKKR